MPRFEQIDSQEKIPAPEKEKGLKIAYDSRPSERHPEHNEDAILVLESQKAAGVFDGMGGHQGGEAAANLARDYCFEALKTLPQDLSIKEAKESLEKILKEADQMVSEAGQEDPSDEKRGTTASLVKICEDKELGRVAVIGNVGDSRVFILHTDGILEQVTIDDSKILDVAEDESEARLMQLNLSRATKKTELTPIEEQLFESREHITQCLGHGQAEPKIYLRNLNPGEIIIITSDGIHDNLTHQEISKIIREVPNSQQAINILINEALNRSQENGEYEGRHLRAKPDDMTAVIMDFNESR